MSDKQEPLIVYCSRHDDQGAIVLVGEDPAQLVGPGMFIQDAGMPEPEEHASVVCEQLNALAGRTPAPKRVTTEEPNPIAGGLAETVRRFGASGLSVDVTGCTIVLTAVEGPEHE